MIDNTAARRSPHADAKKHLEWLQTRPETFVPPSDEFDETPTNTDVDQTGLEAEIIEELGPEVRLQHQQDVSQLTGRIPTTSELQLEFDKLAADKEIPFEYIPDGCYARAHLMCDQLHKDSINSAKMFVMLENPYSPGRLTADNKYMHAEWWYHVAPMVFAADDKTGKVEPFIMDPSMANHPMKPQEWVHAMWDEETPIKIDVTRDAQYGPFEEGGANNDFEESLQPAHDDAAGYMAELKEIKEEWCHNHPGDCNRYLIAA